MRSERRSDDADMADRMLRGFPKAAAAAGLGPEGGRRVEAQGVGDVSGRESTAFAVIINLCTMLTMGSSFHLNFPLLCLMECSH